MTDELIFYTHPMSRGRIVRWMLEEIGHPYRTELLDFGTTMKAPEYLSLNPMGKVPAIRHGDTVVTYRWMFFAAGPVEAAVTNNALGFVMPEGRERMAGYGSFADVINVLEGAVSRDDYVVGDSFTAADVYLGSQVGWGLMFGSIEKRPAFEQYWERIGMRPAALRAREIDDALIPQHKQTSTAG